MTKNKKGNEIRSAIIGEGNEPSVEELTTDNITICLGSFKFTARVRDSDCYIGFLKLDCPAKSFPKLKRGQHVKVTLEVVTESEKPKSTPVYLDTDYEAVGAGTCICGCGGPLVWRKKEKIP